jgi:dTDP-D-glucose 4,6-dehydratase
MATTRIDKIGNAAKAAMIAKNTFNDVNEYSATSPYAKTPLGKESLGSTIDINARTKELAKNKFNSSNEYGPNNLY